MTHLQISMHGWTVMAVRSMRLPTFFGSSFSFMKPHRKKVIWNTVWTKSWSKAPTVMMFGILVWDYMKKKGPVKPLTSTVIPTCLPLLCNYVILPKIVQSSSSCLIWIKINITKPVVKCGFSVCPCLKSSLFISL